MKLEIMAKSIALKKCNLHLLASGHDVNGNKVIRLQFPNSRGFAIQTGGNLKRTGSILRGLKTYKDMETISASDLSIISREVCAYIKKYGSTLQKKKLRTY